MLKKIKTKKQSGFSLLEVLITITFISLVLTPLLLSSGFAFKQNQENKLRTQADILAKELADWLRIEYKGNTNMVVNNANRTFCFNSFPTSGNFPDYSWPSAGNCSSFSLLNIYKRELELKSNADGTLSFIIKVFWKNNEQNPVQIEGIL